MFFLEDLYSNKRPSRADWRSTVGRQPRSLRRDPPNPETSIAGDSLSSSTEHHDRASSVKRNSLFSRRPKSTTTISSADASSQSRNSSALSAGVASHRSSMADAGSDGESRKSKLLFGRHYRKKSSSGKPRPTSPPGLYDETAEAKKDRSRDRHKRGSSIGTNDQVSWISAPFGFHHISKIERSSKNTQQDDIYSELPLSPRQLPTIAPSPPQELQSSLAGRGSRPHKRPPPLRPKRPDETQLPHQLLSPRLGMPSLRQMRSAETFGLGAQLMPRRPVSPLNSTAPLPPRTSSREPQPPKFPEQYHLATGPQDTFANGLSLSEEWDRLLPLYDQQPHTNTQEPGAFSNVHFSPPTDNNFALPMLSPSFNPPLEQVPEEPEGVGSPRVSKNFSRNASIRHARSSPNMSRSGSKSKVRGRANEPPLITVERPTSQGSDTLGDLTRRSFVVGEAVSPEGLHKRGLPSRDTAGSWEDYVDYCYENAAEANCDFDWTNTSRFEDADTSDEDVEKTPIPLPKLAPKHKQTLSAGSNSGYESDHFFNKTFFQQTLIPNRDSIPDLDYRSQHTASSNSLAVGTPRDKFRFPSTEGLRQAGAEGPRKSTDLAGMVSPQLPPLEFRSDMSSEQLYEDLMAGFRGPERAPETLQPKTYGVFSPAVTQLRRKSSSGERNVSFRTRPAPTSVPSLPLVPPPQPPPRLSKELPPLPPLSEAMLEKALQSDPLAVPAKPYSLSVDTIVAQLRHSADSPTEPNETPFSASQSGRRSLPKPDSPRMIRRTRTPTENPIVRIQELEMLPSILSRQGSDESVVTAIAIPPPSPPQSPDRRESALSATSVPQGRSASMSTPSGPAFMSPAPSSYNTTSQNPLPSQPALPCPKHSHRKAASDSAANLNTPPSSPSTKSPTSRSLTVTTRRSYSLFPPPTRPPKQRRVTTS